VQQKVEGEQITLAEEHEGGAQIIDLMEALRASLEKKGGAAPAKKTATATKSARKPAKRVQAAEAEEEEEAPAPKRKAAKRTK
jgi:DNA end-binding protein Ku